MYISKLNNELSQAIDNSLNSTNYNDLYNQGPNSKLSIRLSPERTNKDNKIHRAQSTNNLRVNSINNNINSFEETGFISPSLQIVPSPKRIFIPNAILNDSKNKLNNDNDTNINQNNKTVNHFNTSPKKIVI